MNRLILLNAIRMTMACLIVSVMLWNQATPAAAAVESVWSGSNTGSEGITINNSTDADGSGAGTWADATGATWANSNDWWEFTMKTSN